MKNVSLFAVLFLTAASIAFAQPKIEIVGGDTHDWGKVKAKDSPLKTVVKIKNIGDQVLNITDVHPGCGCTKTADLDKKELQPGEIASTEISLNLGASSGPITKSVSITSNDPTSPSKVLMLKADITRDINITPSPYFAFSGLTIGMPATATVHLQNNSQEDVTIGEITTTNGLILNIAKGTVIKKGTEIEVTANTVPKEKGYFTATCKINTSNTDYPTIDLTAYGDVKEATVATPTPNKK
ncbi:MAG: DUF1573 domain-containing protein [Bacteroidetes bacterium]|nr:DUF1573 domain-containing protein [Bacteroidota bacterium]